MAPHQGDIRCCKKKMGVKQVVKVTCKFLFYKVDYIKIVNYEGDYCRINYLMQKMNLLKK